MDGCQQIRWSPHDGDHDGADGYSPDGRRPWRRASIRDASVTVWTCPETCIEVTWRNDQPDHGSEPPSAGSGTPVQDPVPVRRRRPASGSVWPGTLGFERG